MTAANPITQDGLTRLQNSLKRLREVDRPATVVELSTAAAHGDLRENAEYKAAKEHLEHLDQRIKDLEDALARAEVIDTSKLSGTKVAFGARVRLSNVDTGEEVAYRLVGPYEAELENGSISITSPIARSLIGREVGDEVKVRTPGGERTYEVLGVSFQ